MKFNTITLDANLPTTQQVNFAGQKMDGTEFNYDIIVK